MRFMLVCLFLGVVPAQAIEIKLDDAWIPRLAQLCDAARYGSRMAAEPICNDLAAVVQKAQADEQKTKDAAKPAKPPKN